MGSEEGPRDVAAIPDELALSIMRALRPTAVWALRTTVSRRVRRHAPFAHDPTAWADLTGAIEDGDPDIAHALLNVLVGPERTEEVFALDPTAESRAPAAGPARTGRAPRPRPAARSAATTALFGGTRPAESVSALRRPAVPAVAAPVAGRTVLRVGAPRTVPRPRHERPRREVQRWVLDTRRDPPSSVRVPQLPPRSSETERWRQELQIGELVCPWPGCPEPRLTLKAGPILATHVAHRPGAQDHGAHTNWVLATLAQLAEIAGHAPRALIADPPTVRLGDVVVVLLHYPLGTELIAATSRALRAAPDGATTVGVLRASLLPRRCARVDVHDEREPRWAFPTGRERTLEAIAALAPLGRVLGAPDHADGDDDQQPDPNPRWGRRWIGLGLEARPGQGRLDWRGLPRAPLVAVPIDEETVRRVVRPPAGGPGSQRSSVRGVEAPGGEMEPVLFETAGPVVRCWTCKLTQTVSDGISTDAVNEILDRIDDEDEQAAALEAHDVQYCVYDTCPRCGDGLDRN